MTNTIKLTHTINNEDYHGAVVISNTGTYHMGYGTSFAVLCNSRNNGIYVKLVQQGGDWKVPESAKLCKKCFGS